MCGSRLVQNDTTNKKLERDTDWLIDSNHSLTWIMWHFPKSDPTQSFTGMKAKLNLKLSEDMIGNSASKWYSYLKHGLWVYHKIGS